MKFSLKTFFCALLAAAATLLAAHSAVAQPTAVAPPTAAAPQAVVAPALDAATASAAVAGPVVDMYTNVAWTNPSPYYADLDVTYWDQGTGAGTGVSGSLKLVPGLFGVTCGTKKGLTDLKYDPISGEVSVIKLSNKFNPNSSQVEHVYCRVPCQGKITGLWAESQVRAANELPKQAAIKNVDMKQTKLAACKCGPGMPVPAEACPGGKGGG